MNDKQTERKKSVFVRVLVNRFYSQRKDVSDGMLFLGVISLLDLKNIILGEADKHKAGILLRLIELDLTLAYNNSIGTSA